MTAAADYFEAIGKAVAERTKGDFPSAAEFTRIATEVLQQTPAPAIDVLTMADWVCERLELPRQVNRNASFGQPPLVVYEATGFYAEVLFWFPSRTAIHAHAFTGAFRVLNGASLQVEYAFHQQSAPEHGIRLGRLEERSLELIETGKVCPILDSNDFIHTVVHLGSPSLTLVVRTKGPKDKSMRQFSFLRCGFAYDSFWQDDSLQRQAEVLLALFRVRPDQLWPRLEKLLHATDQHGFYGLLSRLQSNMEMAVFQQTILPRAEAVFAGKWPSAIEALREDIRNGAMMEMMAALTGSERQLQMALSELFPDREQLRSLIRRSYGVADADQVLTDWKARLQAQ